MVDPGNVVIQFFVFEFTFISSFVNMQATNSIIRAPITIIRQTSSNCEVDNIR